MSSEQRKIYNQKRYTPKRRREDHVGPSISVQKTQDDEFDALSSLEREVMKKTQQAQQALARQRMNQPPQNFPTNQQRTSFVGQTNSGGTTVGAHLMQQQVHQQPSQQIQFY